MATTGFRAYHIYQTIKHMHFSKGKFDIMKVKNGYPKRDMFVTKWNDHVRNTSPSQIFLKIDKLYEKDEVMFRLFAHYYLEDPNFYITKIHEDGFKLSQHYERELVMLKEVIESDMAYILLASRKNNLSLKKILFASNKIPYIFQMFDKNKISMHSLIAFDMVFGIHDKIDKDNLNIVEEEKLRKYKNVVDKYVKIVYKFYDFDVKKYVQQIYRRLNT